MSNVDYMNERFNVGRLFEIIKVAVPFAQLHMRTKSENELCCRETGIAEYLV